MNRFALVEPADHPALSKFKWYAVKTPHTFYAARSHNKSQIRMHRQILNAPPNLIVDHIDHNGLNNTRKNLRLATPAQNARNQKPRKNKSSKYKGVCFHKRDKTYHARIYHNGKPIHIGCFKNEKDAAKAYDKKAKKLHKQFAFINFTD
ncbi:MAG: HNH endonuclease [Anaerohalosphaera sp.]|nr:HNH endonuclease [Anaerohalosphaera sp.]